MKINKAFKFKLSPTPEQFGKLSQFAGNTRFLWNKFLEIEKAQYEKDGKFIWWCELSKMTKDIVKEYPFLKDSPSVSLYRISKVMSETLSKCGKKNKQCGFPRFKKRGHDSFFFYRNLKFTENSLRIPKLGYIGMVKDCNFRGEPKQVTISLKAGKWYASILCAYEIPDKNIIGDNIVGIDVGLKVYATLSDGTKIDNIKTTKKYAKKLRRENKKLSRKKKGSSNFKRQVFKLQKVHNKIDNIRNNFLHNATSQIVKKYDGVKVEDLSVKTMIGKNKSMNKSILDASWFEFKRQLEYKCKWNFKSFGKIDRYNPSSQACSGCGKIQPMPLNQRLYKCECGLELDRDLNASLNILKGTVVHTESKACGEKIRPTVKRRQFSAKQEKLAQKTGRKKPVRRRVTTSDSTVRQTKCNEVVE